MSARFRLAPKPAAEATPKAAPAPAAAPPAAPKPAKISAVLKGLFATERITDKAGLDAWCGAANRRRLYALLREQAPEHWARVANPKAATRAAYQALLVGFGAADSMSDEEAPPASPAPVGGAGSPPATPPASPAAASPSPPATASEALALMMATDLAEVHKREIARLTAVEAEYEALKAKMAATKLRQKEAHRAYMARKKATQAAGGAGAPAEPKSKEILDVFDFFPELVEELASEDPGY